MANILNVVQVPTTISIGTVNIYNATARERPIRVQPFYNAPTTAPEDPA